MLKLSSGFRRISSDLIVSRHCHVGGALAGLFAGSLLRQLGHNITILKRSSTPLLRDQVAGIVAGDETSSS